jgi:hypothetical protein
MTHACMSRKDYYVNVVDRTHVEVKLAADAWMPAGKSGDLKVVAVDTGAGKVTSIVALPFTTTIITFSFPGTACSSRDLVDTTSNSAV